MIDGNYINVFHVHFRFFFFFILKGHGITGKVGDIIENSIAIPLSLGAEAVIYTMKKKGEIQNFMTKAPYNIHNKVTKRLVKNHWKEATPKFAHKFIEKRIKKKKEKKRIERLRKTKIGRLRLNVEKYLKKKQKNKKTKKRK